MPTIDDIAAALQSIAPTHLAEDWDNVGLLVGDRASPAQRVMTCLTLTAQSVDEAIQRGADLVVSHHPLPFRPLQRMTTDTVEGRMLWRLAGAGVSVYSAHTAYDSAATGINQRLATALGLEPQAPLIPHPENSAIGAGRLALPAGGLTLRGLVAAAKSSLGLGSVRIVGQDDQSVGAVALACGSGGSLLEAAIAAGCDVFVTGEATFHTCLAAEAQGVSLLLLGHYASERFAVEALAEVLSAEVPGVEVWPCSAEQDPLRTI